MYKDFSHLPQNKRDGLQPVVEVVRASTAFHLTDRIEALLKFTESAAANRLMHFRKWLNPISRIRHAGAYNA